MSSLILSFQPLVIHACGDSVRWMSSIVSALVSSSCPSVHTNGVCANSGIRVVLCERVDSQQLLTQHFVQSWRSFAVFTTQAPNSLSTLTIGTCGSNRKASYRQLLVSQLPPDQSTLLYNPPKTQVWKGSCQDPIPPEFQDKVTLTISCLGGHQKNSLRH